MYRHIYNNILYVGLGPTFTHTNSLLHTHAHTHTQTRVKCINPRDDKIPTGAHWTRTVYIIYFIIYNTLLCFLICSRWLGVAGVDILSSRQWSLRPFGRLNFWYPTSVPSRSSESVYCIAVERSQVYRRMSFHTPTYGQIVLYMYCVPLNG